VSFSQPSTASSNNSSSSSSSIPGIAPTLSLLVHWSNEWTGNPTSPCPTIPYTALPCPVPPCPVLPCLTLPCPALPYNTFKLTPLCLPTAQPVPSLVPGSVPGLLPGLIAFDLDGTVWSPDMYMLWGGGAPFARVGDGRAALRDRKGQRVSLLGISGEVNTILQYYNIII
jgi:hypothetical protein